MWSAVLDRKCFEQYKPFFDTTTIGEQLSAVLDRKRSKQDHSLILRQQGSNYQQC